MFIKRIITFAIMLGLFAANAFAQFSVGGGVDMIVVPLQVVTQDQYEDNTWFGAGMGSNGALMGIRTRLNLSGKYEEKIGFRTDIWFLYTNNGANLWSQSAGSNPSSPDTRNPNALDIRLGDHGSLWWRPTDWLKFDIGRVFNSSQAGNIQDHWLSPWSIGMFDGGNIFSSHYSGNIGALAQYTPPQIEGLSVFVFVPQFGMPFTDAQYEDAWLGGPLLTNGADKLNDTGDIINRNSNRAFRVYQRTWVTVGYSVPETLQARIQFIGANPGGSVNWTTGAEDSSESSDVEPHSYRVTVSAPRIEAAFAFAVKGLVMDIGMKSWLPVSNWITDTWDNDLDTNSYIKLENTGTYWGGIGFGFGIFYNGLMDGNLVINFRADGDMLRSWTGTHKGVDTKIVNPMRLSFHLWPSYTIPGFATITASAGVNYIGRNTVDIGGANPNDGSLYWENADRFRFGGGLALDMPLFGTSVISLGLAYRHGTSEGKGGEPRGITVPISFYYSW